MKDFLLFYIWHKIYAKDWLLNDAHIKAYDEKRDLIYKETSTKI